MTLREQILEDIADGVAWFNMDEFAAWHDIDGEKVLCVLFGGDNTYTPETHMDTDGLPQEIYRYNRTLLVRNGEEGLTDVRKGSPLTVNGVSYIIIEAILILDIMWKIRLATNDGGA